MPHRTRPMMILIGIIGVLLKRSMRRCCNGMGWRGRGRIRGCLGEGRFKRGSWRD
jgi:hypothetical protein